MDFIKKNDFIVKHKSEKYFEQDLCLFKQHFPESRLHPELKRASSYNKRTLDGYMLNDLLDKVSADDILSNRKKAATLNDLIDKIGSVDEKESKLAEKEEELAEKESKLAAQIIVNAIKNEDELKALIKEGAQASKKKANTMSSPE